MKRLIFVCLLLWGCGQPPKPPQAYQFEEKLSDYRFFNGPLKTLTAAAGVQHYDLHTPLFTDYALKDRFIVLPAGKAVQYKDSGALEFPDSTFIIKNFSYNDTTHVKMLIETRLLFKDPFDHKWKVMNYLWNAEQTEAVKWIMGKKVPITLLDDQQQKVSTVYQVPNTNDCKRCHSNNGELLPIGPKARNLRQLAEWAANGSLKGIQNIPPLPDWKDSVHYTVAQRARAYLDVNCAHCHTKGGDAYNTGLFLEYEQNDPTHLGVLKGPVSAGGGAGGLDYDILPGHAEQSILAYRMNSTEPGTAMPELARTLIHKEGVALIKAWIDQLPRNQ